MKAYLLILLLLISCAAQLTPEQQAFKEKCLANGHQWMKMSEMKDGMMIGEPCSGCMLDERTHLCTQAEYEAHLK
jgi:hypothetical protein